MKWYTPLLYTCAAYALTCFCLKQTDGFTINAISPSRSPNPPWETRPLNQDETKTLACALEQNYSYLGCGGQSFIFISADNNYVIKFFKQRVFEMPLWLRYVHLPWKLDNYRKKKLWTRQDKLKRDFESYVFSFNELQNHTGVVFVHLGETNSINKQLTIVDKLGIQHNIDLDKMDFLIQKKAVLALDKIAYHMQNQENDLAKHSIHALVHLIVDRCKQGFHDRDPNIRTNCGFIGENAVKIDVGRFVKDPRMPSKLIYTSEVKRITHPFKLWLEQHAPSLVDTLDEEIAQLEDIE